MSGLVLWVTGKPSSGKSTFAGRLKERLIDSGTSCCLLDGDEVRQALKPAPGYTESERDEFYKTLANLAALVARQNLVAIVPATASKRSYREYARSIAPAFIEVFVDVPQSEVEARDAKGLYRAVRQGQLKNVPGADLPFEAPLEADVVAQGGLDGEALAKAARSVQLKLEGT